jgi:hypothetical protein
MKFDINWQSLLKRVSEIQNFERYSGRANDLAHFVKQKFIFTEKISFGKSFQLDVRPRRDFTRKALLINLNSKLVYTSKLEGLRRIL